MKGSRRSKEDRSFQNKLTNLFAEKQGYNPDQIRINYLEQVW